MPKRLFLFCGIMSLTVSACATTSKDPSLYTNYSCDELRNFQTSYKTLEATETRKRNAATGLQAGISNASSSTSPQYKGVNEIGLGQKTNNNLSLDDYAFDRDLPNKNKSLRGNSNKELSNYKSARAAYRQNGCKATS